MHTGAVISRSGDVVTDGAVSGADEGGEPDDDGACDCEF